MNSLPLLSLFELRTYSFGDKLVKPDAAVPLWGAGLRPHVSLGVVGLLEAVLRLDGFRIKLHSSCRNRSNDSAYLYSNAHFLKAKLG